MMRVVLNTDVVAAAKKLTAMQALNFFVEREGRADLVAFRRILNRAVGEPPREDDRLD